MTSFDEWFESLDGFVMKCERFYDQLFADRVSKHHIELYINWLRAAYIAGQESVKDK